MPEPGDSAGDCPDCETPMVCIGVGHSVLGAYCKACEILVSMVKDTRSLESTMAAEEGAT